MVLASSCWPSTFDDTQGSDRNAEMMNWLEGILRAQHVNTDSESLLNAVISGKELIVRVSAARLLGLRKEKKAVEVLKQALHSDPEAVVKETAAWSLAYMGYPEGKNALKELIAKADDVKRQSMLAAELAELGDPSEYPYVVKAISSPDAEIRFLSTDNLWPFLKYEGKHGKEAIDALARLQTLVHDKAPKVRAEALSVLNRAVPNFLPRNQLQPLVEQLSKEDPDPQVRQTADRILQVWQLTGGTKSP